VLMDTGVVQPEGGVARDLLDLELSEALAN
jgi:hypothetical protein